MKFLLFVAIIASFAIGCKQENIIQDKQQSIQSDSIVINTKDSIDNDIALQKAPDFKLVDINGSTKSLADFKGKLIYLDIWATWCRPCIMQIPAMKKLETKYADKGIEFLSISVDPDKDKEKWKETILTKNMSGTHLFAGTESSFGYDYKVEFVPKFLIISADGNILMENAPQAMDMMTGDVNAEIEAIFDLYIKSNQ